MGTFLRAASVCALAAMLAGGFGCDRDRHVKLPVRAGDPVGSIQVLLTQSADDLTVSVNGQLVANRANTKKLRVDNVPIGTAQVIIAAGGGPSRIEHHLRVLVEQGQTTTIPVAGPDRSASRTVWTAALSVVAFVASRAIYLAFF